MGSGPFWNAQAPASPGQLTYITTLQQENLITDEDLLLLAGVEVLEDLSKVGASTVNGLLRNESADEIQRAIADAKARKVSA
jgi:collagenase-like PrtC family protease